jgi:hypothetical protein
LPSAAVACGLEQAVKAPPSTLHWKLLPPSVDENENVGVEVEMVEPSPGPAVIEVFGGSLSVTATVKLRPAGEAS